MNNQVDHAALVMRLSLGSMYLAHGLLKLIVFTPAGTANYFAQLGLHEFMAYGTLGAEILAGILLIIGFQSRWVAAAMMPVLAGSIVFVHGANGWLFSNEGGGWEFPAFLMAASVVQFILGDGRYAITPMLKRTHRSCS